MKKILGILVLGLLWCGPSFADTEESKEIIPEWFINIPETTEKMVYARATAIWDDKQISMQEALSKGLIELCKKIYTRITVTEKLNADGSKTTTTTTEVAGVGSDKCSLSEYKVEKIKTIQLDNGMYRTFLILKTPVDK